MLGILVGLKQEARLATRFFPGAKVALSHACETGAVRALGELRDAGVTELLSFGCAGGLDASLPPGTVQIADYVQVEGTRIATNPQLSQRLGIERAPVRGGILHSATMVALAREKGALFRQTACHAVDMESGVVAQSGLPFAVLRVICDDAGRDLPPAAAEGLKEGRVHVPALLGSIIRQPSQIGALITLGRDATKAQRSMLHFLQNVPFSDS